MTPRVPEALISFTRRLIVAIYLVEAGLWLVLVPWLPLWDHNYFGAVLPRLGVFMRNDFVRGGVSGVGLITAFAGLRDVTSVLFARPHRAAPPDGERP